MGTLGKLMRDDDFENLVFTHFFFNFSLPNCITDKCEKCSNTVYSPVCGADNHVYFSPCHAGCGEDDKVVFKTEGGASEVSGNSFNRPCLMNRTNASVV